MQEHTAAIEQARQALIRPHFDYSASNWARMMQSNFTRVITMFKQHSQNMTYLLWRNAHPALKGESPEVRREEITNLWNATTPAGTPKFSTILKVIKVLKIKLHATPGDDHLAAA